MATRDNPYGAFKFIVQLGTDGDPTSIAGGFSDVCDELRPARRR